MGQQRGQCLVSSMMCGRGGVLALWVLWLMVMVTATTAQDAQSTPAQQSDPVTDPPIILTPGANSTNTSSPSPPSMGEGEEGEEGQEGQEGAEGQEGQEGAEGQEGQEGAEGQEAEGAEGQEAPEQEEAEGPQEALEDQIEDLVEMYRKQGLTASLEALHTLYPGVNLTDIFWEIENEGGPGGEENEMEDGNEHGLQGSEGGVSPMPGHPHHHQGLHPMQSMAPDVYGDYELDMLGQNKASYRYQPGGPGIKPSFTQPLAPAVYNTEGGQARLFDNVPARDSGYVGPFNPDSVVRHPTGMTASATFGVVVGTVLLSWLIVGPMLCLAWRWRQGRQEKRRTLLQRAELRGSVDEGIMQAMVMSDLGGRAGSRGGAPSKRRQQEDDVEEALRRNRSALQAFPTTTTLESRVV